ncbi:hypothetical protein LJC15_01070 [Desulfovibrio sp. OttesenSCG-928-G11]|nr:hypothetical protein [Desulfovibrio sp. OttesenSCG-928-G11]
MQAPRVRYLTEKAVSEMTGIPVRSLQQHRFHRTGLPYVKFGQLVRYDLQDVVAHLEACKVRHEG